MYYCILILIHILGQSHQIVSSRLHYPDLPFSVTLLTPTTETQPIRQTPLLKSLHLQHGFPLTLAIPVQCGLDLQHLPCSQSLTVTPISCPTATWQSSVFPTQQQLQVPFADHWSPCTGTIQTENSSQLTAVLQEYFYCSPLLQVLSLTLNFMTMRVRQILSGQGRIGGFHGSF